MVFQDYALFPHLDVAGNISFGLKGSREQRRQRTETMLSLVGLEGFGARSLQGLSGGQQQRVALARALAPEPALVLLDEPFSNLDTHLRVRLRAEVRAILRATGTTAVFVTHDQEEALSVADQVAVMSAGRLLQVAEPWRLYHEPASRAVASLVGESNFLTAEASGRIARCAIGELELRQPAAGEVTLLLRPESLHVTGDGPLRVEEVQFFGDHQRLQLRLADNTALTAQTDNSRRFRAGQRVGVKVHGPVLALTV